jgi:hypothetical protein
MSKRILQQLGIIASNESNNKLTNLTKIPKKEPKSVMPHTTAFVKYAVEQADLLFLPEDDGYKYVLVVVDIATRLTDAEPLKTKNANDVKNALIKIYKRRILKMPKRIEVDAGAEFKGVFKTYFDKYTDVYSKIAGRHRQQSVVESKNHLIGNTLNHRMLAEEINNEEASHSWVDILPNVIKLINQHYAHNPPNTADDLPIRTDKFSSAILDIGTPVRVMLDNPINYVDGSRLHGHFRAGDIRWENQIRHVTRLFLRPDQPPMYQVDSNPKVAYTKYQLQVVRENEAAPVAAGQKRFTISRLVKRFKKDNKIFFRVLWGDGSFTNEPRAMLIKDIPVLIREFEEGR